MVDLRSDTLTMPDYPMLETILTARLGDDGRTDAKGRGEDPTINRLEDIANPVIGRMKEEYVPPRPFKKGDLVLVVQLNEEGVLLSDPDSSGKCTGSGGHHENQSSGQRSETGG